jgi:hypothetical protein
MKNLYNCLLLSLIVLLASGCTTIKLTNESSLLGKWSCSEVEVDGVWLTPAEDAITNSIDIEFRPDGTLSSLTVYKPAGWRVSSETLTWMLDEEILNVQGNEDSYLYEPQSSEWTMNHLMAMTNYKSIFKIIYTASNRLVLEDITQMPEHLESIAQDDDVKVFLNCNLK